VKAQFIAAFEESLRDAPDQESVLTGLRAGIERHRRRRRRQRMTVAMAAVVVFVVASVVAVVSVRQRALPPADPPPAPAPVETWPTTLRPTWLPDGMSLVRTATLATSETLLYSSGDRFLYVDVDKVDLERAVDLPGWQQTVVNGRPGRSVDQGGLAVRVFQLPSGRWAKVSLTRNNPRGTADLTTMSGDATQVANALTEVDGPPLGNSFELGYLPKDQRVIGRENGPGDPKIFGTIICSAGTLRPGESGKHLVVNGIDDVYREPDLGVGLKVYLARGPMYSMVGWEKVADVHGLPAYENVNSHAVVVPNFRAGTLMVEATVNGSTVRSPYDPALMPRAELIKVLEGVR
jgi:hypothetical protein